MEIKNKKNIIMPLLIVACFFTIIVPTQSAFAASLTWDFATHVLGDGFVGTAAPVQIFYDDSADGGLDLSDGTIDTISVHVTSDSDPVGIMLTLSEDPTIGGGGINTGQYTNRNLIFSSTQFSLTDTADLRITNYPANVTLGVDSLSVKATSISDITGVTFSLTETGGNTGIFTGQLKFTSGASSGNILNASPGDIISLKDLNSGLTSNSLIIPNSDPTVGEIKASIGDNVVVSFGVLSDTTSISNDEPVPGGGGGGLVIHPGFVLDIIRSIVGGSPFIVTPPSFGGGIFHYTDGLTIIQNNIENTFDISTYNKEIPLQVLVANQPVEMTFKIYENYNPNAIVHSGLYFIPRGSDMIVPNSIASIVYEKGLPVQISDPSKLLTDVSTTFKTNGPFEYVTFNFTPTQSYDKMSFLDRSWNDHRYSTDVRIHDEASPVQVTHTLPQGIMEYYAYSDLITKLENDGYQKPQILAHIHDTHEIFGSNDMNQIYWSYNTTDNIITLKIIDKEKNTLYSFAEKLVQTAPPPMGDYGFMKFTVSQLNRQNVDQEKNTMKEEYAKAVEHALMKYPGYPFSKW